MAKGTKKGTGTDRRRFLAGAGAALAFGATAGLTSCTRPAAIKLNQNLAAGRIDHDASLCAGCGVCGLMCSIYHEKEASFVLARSELVREPFEAAFVFNVCRQCASPSCHLACPLRDSALCIDEGTGVKYIDAAECSGCGECIRACPLEPARVKIDSEKLVAYKCDLCRGREAGPICVEYCGQHALTIVPGNWRA